MSVSIEGIKGYEYQYKITVLFALIYGKKSENKLFVEKVGSEDITFIDENCNLIEIQIKREKKELTIYSLFEWLFHFQARSADNNLLLRIKNKTSKCLFITRSRCNDETKDYLNEFPSIEINNRKSKNDLKSIIDSIKSITLKKTPLDIKRNDFRNNFVKQLNKQDVEILLNNIIIWEQLDDDKVDDFIINLLNKKHLISQANSEIIYLKLLESVKKGRDNKGNIIPIFIDKSRYLAKFNSNFYRENQ